MIDSACFPGCVQLLANVFVARGCAAAAAAGTGVTWGDGGKLGSVSAAVLARVQDIMRGLGTVARAGSGPQLAAQPVHIPIVTDQPAAAFEDAPGAAYSSPDALEPAAPSTPSLSDAETEPDDFRLSGPSPDSQPGVRPDSLPGISIVFGSSVAESWSADCKPRCSNSGAAVPLVALECCEPACLVAGKSQKLVLHLQLACGQDDEATAAVAASAVWAGGKCRLLVFQDGAVVVDETVELNDTIG